VSVSNDLASDAASGSLGGLLRRAGARLDSTPSAYRTDDVIAGRYRLVESVGRGGMGEVWKAEHIGLGRVLAVKLLPPHRASTPATRRRFSIEARAATRVDHHGSVAVHDVGIDERGAPYIVMEFVRGRTLASYLAGARRISPRIAVDLAIQLAETLQAAHGQGVVHRDLKPENIVLTRAGKRMRTTILDFGLAKFVDTDLSALTRSGQILGTPSTMSPEQIRGEVVGGRADVYALGCVTYWMLEGRAPFPGNDLAALLFAHANQAPPRPTARAPYRGARALADLVIAMLAKDPAARPDAGRFVELARAIDFSRGEASTPTVHGRSRTRVLVVAAAVGLLAVVNASAPSDRSAFGDATPEMTLEVASANTATDDVPRTARSEPETGIAPPPAAAPGRAREATPVPATTGAAPAPQSSESLPLEQPPAASPPRRRDGKRSPRVAERVDEAKDASTTRLRSDATAAEKPADAAAAAERVESDPAPRWFDREYDRARGVPGG
jgi:serine/threonine-protein kinase